MTTSRVRRAVALAASSLLLTAALALTTPWAHAQSESGMITIPLGTVVRAEPGSLVLLDEVAVPTDFIGADCRIESRAENNSSVHPGNDLVVASDGTSVVLSDVEGEPGKVTTAVDRLRLGSGATLTLRMGPDGVFSGGATAVVVIQCFPDETTTTTTTTTVPPATTSTTSTTTTTTTIAGPTTSLVTTTTAPVTTTTEAERVIPQAPPAQPQQEQPSFTG